MGVESWLWEEAKSAAHGGNNYSICRELLRVGIFYKNALDNIHNMKVYWVCGLLKVWLRFYALVLQSTGRYVMYDDELENIKILRSDEFEI
ncbi:hypothetical protein G6F42_018665 [Rhizopus arrhizus]|nr:hypothetical protein G6F42_018665 [Rhizopus arrhizus]